MIYLFDVDGTLTSPMKEMDKSFVSFFSKWMKNKEVFLVAGSDIEKVKKQIPKKVLSKMSGVFCCMGNELRMKNKVIYSREWLPDASIYWFLIQIRNTSKYENKKDKWCECRTGMMNFSIAGRSSSPKERQLYSEWDKKKKERIKFARDIEKEFPKLEARVGGQISIDIQPKNFNKSQASKWIRKNFKKQEMLFFGDKCQQGGNDYDLCLDLEKNEDGKYHQVSHWKETRGILQKLS